MGSHTRSLQRWTQLLTGIFFTLALSMSYLIWRDRQSSDTLAPATEATSIVIQRNGFDDIQLSKRDDEWHLDAPCSLPANMQRLEPLLGALAPGAHQYTASEVDLEAAGLIVPLAIVHINEVEHRIGNTDLNGERRYVQRGNSVAFVPEWVLSLVNGGVTALAKLDVFPEPLSSISLVMSDGTSTTLNSAEDVNAWQELTAQQIITWPLPDEDANSKAEALYTMQLNGLKDQTEVMKAYENATFTALHRAGDACAYILPVDALPHHALPD